MITQANLKKIFKDYFAVFAGKFGVELDAVNRFFGMFNYFRIVIGRLGDNGEVFGRNRVFAMVLHKKRSGFDAGCERVLILQADVDLFDQFRASADGSAVKQRNSLMAEAYSQDRFGAPFYPSEFIEIGCSVLAPHERTTANDDAVVIFN